MNSQPMLKPVNRQYKDTLFRRLFSDKEKLLELYNALNGSHYDNPDDLTINTLEDAVYMNMKNDLSFIFHSRMPLYEHQSTVSPNIPLRDLDYVNRLLRGITAGKDLYSSHAVKVPAPQFVVFYNGIDELPERSIRKLSELYEIPQEDPGLELAVTILNINPGYNRQLMETSRTLSDYSLFVARVRACLRDHETAEEKYEAVARAVDECIDEGILADFLRKHREEAIGMSLFEYNEEQHLKTVREEGWEDGYSKGHDTGYFEGHERAFLEMVSKGLLTISQAAEACGVTEDYLETELINYNK